MSEKLIVCWSGGKDSSLALHELLQDDGFEVVSLLTTCNERFQRVSMHGVRVGLALRQAATIGLPLDVIYLSERPSDGEYESKMLEYLLRKKAEGVTAVAFGDIFLQDLRKWRESNLAQIGLRGVFPLWLRDTRRLINEFVSSGFKSIVCCVSDAYFGAVAVGTVIDKAFIDTLPAGVDPCGENGEFHSFTYDGPIFTHPVGVEVGEKVYRRIDLEAGSSVTCAPASSDRPAARGFWFCDLLEM